MQNVLAIFFKPLFNIFSGYLERSHSFGMSKIEDFGFIPLDGMSSKF
jgi:hypothetical protein